MKGHVDTFQGVQYALIVLDIADDEASAWLIRREIVLGPDEATNP
jgi:hypothetical protein